MTGPELEATEQRGNQTSVRITLAPPPDHADDGANRAIWHRFDSTTQDIQAALQTEIGLDAPTANALTAEETRPRCTAHGGGALLILRGVNTEPGGNAEDMVSVRLWLDTDKIVTFQFRHLDVIDDLASELAAGNGPGTPGDFIVVLADRLTDRMQEIIDGVDAALDDLEDAPSRKPVRQMRKEIAVTRRKIVLLRRFIAPQRDALDVLIAEPFDWQSSLQEQHLNDTVDRITRLVEQLDTMYHRASILQDFISVRVAERLNRTMVLLSFVAGVFLPLGFVTGLLGMNVAGIPWAASPYAFLTISLALVLVGLGAFVALWKFGQE